MYLVRSVAHRVKISSIVLFFNLDWAVATGPDVEAAAVADVPVGALAVALGKLKGADVVVASPIDAADVAAVAEDAGG